MWRNYLAAAVHNLFRNRAYAAINLVGLAIGFTAAILIGLYVRDELSYDGWHPNADRVFRLSTSIDGPARASLATVDERYGEVLATEFPEVEVSARMWSDSGYLKYRDTSVFADFGIAEPSFLALFPPVAVAGDPQEALKQPDGLVITRRIANALFGRTDVLGQSVAIDVYRTPVVVVRAVIEDLPSNTHLNYQVLVSAVGKPASPGRGALTYLRLRKDADLKVIGNRLPVLVQRVLGDRIASARTRLRLTALRDIHFMPPSAGDMNPPSDRRTVTAFFVVGLITLGVAASNFVGMMTARAARRAVEVGVRKAVGATRSELRKQFFSESCFYVGLALAVSLVAVEILLPAFNGFLQRSIAFDYLRDPALGLQIVAVTLAIALAAGAWPAIVLARFRPVVALRGGLALPAGSDRGRALLVTVQFGTLIALLVATLTIQRQTRFAIEEQLRVPGEEIFSLRAPCDLGAFKQIALSTPGVRSAACVAPAALTSARGSATFTLTDGNTLNLQGAAVDTAYFETFGVAPIAGRLFEIDRGADNVLSAPGATANPSIVLNESAARALGFADAREAVGKSRRWSRLGFRANGQFGMVEPTESEIIGVVPDFSTGDIRALIPPTAFYVDPRSTFLMLLKFDGGRIPETLSAIEAAWRQASGGRPMVGGRFLSQTLDAMYADIRRQSRLFAAFSAVCIVVSALGLLGLAVFTAERRTREIGVRKCLGASRGDILRFIGWQFARPVLLSNLIAWPVAWIFMRRWLDGFAYHVDIGMLTFVGASLVALVIAVLTVTGHALLVSRARPVEALRYE